MKKIFPFYKGENISNNPLGYTTKKSAAKRMKDDKVIEDFKLTLPDDYLLNHFYVYELENPYEEGLSEKDHRISTSIGWYYTVYHTIGYIKHNSRTKLKELPDNIYKLFIELRNTTIIAEQDYLTNTVTESNKVKYKKLLFDILKCGYYPCLFKDERDYKKKLRKFIEDNVEFREMDVEIKLQ